MVDNNYKEKIINLCEQYGWTEDEYVNQLLNRADLSQSERLLFKAYTFECNCCYMKLARYLNSSKYIVTKEIKKIRNKIINTHKNF